MNAQILRELVRSMVFVGARVKQRELSTLAMKVLATLLKCFDQLGRNRLIYFLLRLSPRTGVIGHVITMLKDEIAESSRSQINQ